MVGGTRFHRWIHKASLGRNAGKRKDSFREEGKKRAPTARTVYVSLDRADAIIEGGRAVIPKNAVGWHVQTRKQKLESRNSKRDKTQTRKQKLEVEIGNLNKQIPHPAKSAGIRDDRRRGEQGPHRPTALAG